MTINDEITELVSNKLSEIDEDEKGIYNVDTLGVVQKDVMPKL